MSEEEKSLKFCRGPLMGLDKYITITPEIKNKWRLELYKIAEFFGGPKKFCEALGVERQTFYMWRDHGVSGKNAVYLEGFVNERAGKNFTSRYDLSPWFQLSLCEDTTAAIEEE